MPLVDSHCHVSPVWYEPVESLLFQMDRNGVDHAILIQMQHQFNNDYQFECVRRYPGKFAPVVVIDTASPDAVATLERLADQGASGIRLFATTRSPGEQPLLLWRAAARLGLPVSCAGTSADFAAPEFAELAAALDDLPIVIEHLGSVNRPETSDADRATRLRVFDLARFPHLYIKIPGLGEFCRRALPVTEPDPFVTPIPDYLAQAYQSFGPRRMMWGSDYPPVASREGYTNALRLPYNRFTNMTGVTDDDRAWIFGDTALSVFTVR